MSDNDDNSVLQAVIAEEKCEEIKSINLQEFDAMASATIKKKVNHLLNVRKEIQKNMTPHQWRTQ